MQQRTVGIEDHRTLRPAVATTLYNVEILNCLHIAAADPGDWSRVGVSNRRRRNRLPVLEKTLYASQTLRIRNHGLPGRIYAEWAGIHGIANGYSCRPNKGLARLQGSRSGHDQRAARNNQAAGEKRGKKNRRQLASHWFFPTSAVMVSSRESNDAGPPDFAIIVCACRESVIPRVEALFET